MRHLLFCGICVLTLSAIGCAKSGGVSPTTQKIAGADARVNSTPNSVKHYNVLFLISDDLRTETGNYGGLAKTPNIDALAAKSVQFDRAYCQYPLCNPSRSSLMTGRYPLTTGVTSNTTAFRTAHPDWITLPQLFKENGYASLRTGKIFHGGIDDPKAWTEGGDAQQSGPPVTDEDSGAPMPYDRPNHEPTYQPKTLTAEQIAAHRAGAGDNRNLTQAQRSDRWLVLDDDGEGSAENRVAEKAIDYLRRYKDKQFFIGCGFSKPHSPPTAPAKYYDLYDVNQIPLPPDYATIPTIWPGFPVGSIRPRNADLFIGRESNPQTAREMTRGYLASVSWMDWNVGRVLTELDKLGLRDNTIIIFWGDHGYQLGEKGKWSKAGSVWEQGARVPFTMYVPDAAGNGKVCKRTIEMVDLYPTLAELCGLPKPGGLEGRSIASLLTNPQLSWDHPAYTEWDEPALKSRAVRIDHWRYAEFVTPNGGGSMLLDEIADPHEMKNLTDDPKYADVKQKMADLLRKFPGGNAAATP